MDLRFVTCPDYSDSYIRNDFDTPCSDCVYCSEDEDKCLAYENGRDFELDLDPTTQWPRWCPTIRGTIANVFRDGELYTAGEVAQLLHDLLGTDCPCDYNGVEEWFKQACPAVKSGECPSPKDTQPCWESFVRIWMKR